MSRIYQDGTYLENNPTWHIEHSPWKAKQIIKMIERNNLQPDTICEVGCGAGEILAQLSQQLTDNINYSGYEISEQAYGLCQKRASENIYFYQENLLEREDQFFDIVMAIDVFEHVEDYFGFLRKLKTKGRYKIFHIPLEISVQTVLRGTAMPQRRKSVGHLHYFTKENALMALEECGYKIKDYFYTPSSVDLPSREVRQNSLKLPRKVLFSFNQDLAVRLLGGFSLMVLAE